MTTGLCPRCGGTDIYFAKRQVIKGPGGAWGVRARMVDTPLCRACGEVANVDRSAEKRELRKNAWTRDKKTLKKWAIVYAVLLVLFLGYYFFIGA